MDAAQELYLDLYDELTDDAEYLQAADTERHHLPADLIIAALAWALGAFANGIFQRWGERIADGVEDKVRNLLHRDGGLEEKEPVIEALDKLRPYLSLLQDASQEEQDSMQAWLAQGLIQRGYPERVATPIAGRLLRRLLQEGRSS
jgi:hypothetical protein